MNAVSKAWANHADMQSLQDDYDDAGVDARQAIAARIADLTERQADLLDGSTLAAATVGYTAESLREVAADWREKAAA